MNFRSHDMKDYVTKLVTEYKDDFPEYVKLAEIVGVIPVSSTDAERRFSCMKRIKTSQRSSLEEEKLKDLMILSLEGPPLNGSKSIIDSEIKKKFEKKKAMVNLKKEEKGPMIFKMYPLFETQWVPGTHFHEFSTTALPIHCF